MIKFRILRMFAIALVCFACDDGIIEVEPGPLPEADFIFQIQTSNENSVSFASTSTNVDVLQWDFGDGSFSTSDSPTKTYSENGVFEVTLTASNTFGISTKAVEIEISGPKEPEADFTLSFEDIESGLTVRLNNTSEFADSFEWNFGDGNTSEDGSLSSYTYDAPGTYSIRLTAISADERIPERERENSRRIEVAVYDETFLTGGNSKTWGFKVDTTDLSVGEVTGYFVEDAEGLSYQLPILSCMSDDDYEFRSSGVYNNNNYGDGWLLSKGGQCSSIEEEDDRNWIIQRNSNTSFSLVVSGGYIGDPEIGSTYTVISLEPDFLHLEVERESPVTGSPEFVNLLFEPK